MRSTVHEEFWAGFRAILPLWLGALPIGLSYAVAARTAGLSAVETQLMSLLVFSAGTQLSAINLLLLGASGGTIIFTTLLLNIHQLLFGLMLVQRIALDPTKRLVAAYFLNDGAFGATIARSEPTFRFLLGAELSMFFVWNGATFAGILVGQLVPNLGAFGFDFVVPLLFLGLLVPQLRSQAALPTALIAAALAFVVARIAPTSVAVLVAVLGASLGGALSGNEQ